MTQQRKTWQHDFEEISEAQFSLLIKEVLRWTVDRFGRDYGEDLFIRIFDEGNPTGHDFYVQLKGTDNIRQYELKGSPSFSYSVDLSCLKQWCRFQWPVVFVLWDISQRNGYWLHVQPYIDEKLDTTPNWLNNTNNAKDPKRRIHILKSNKLSDQTLDLLREMVDAEYERTKIGRDYSKQMRGERESEIDLSVQNPAETVSAISKPVKVSPNVQQQLDIAQYQAEVESDPSDFTAWLKLAETYYDLNELDKALRAINNAWKLNNEDPNIINGRACILTEYAIARGGKPKSMLVEAVSLYKSLQPKSASPALLNYNIGNSLSALDEYQEAINYYDHALKQNPGTSLEAQIWKNRGTVFYHLGDHEEEIKSYQKAIELSPDLWQAYSSWGITEMVRGDFEVARSLLEQAMVANPEIGSNNYGVLYSLAYVLWKLNDLTIAYQRVNELLVFKPDHKDGLLLKGHLLAELWETDAVYIPSAITFFKNRLLDDSDDLFARNELYWIYNSEGYDNEARLILEKSVQLDDVPPQLLYRYAMLLETDQKPYEAIRYLETAFECWKEHHIVHNLARLKKKVGDYESAIYYYRLALNDVSDPILILHSIANCYHFSRNYLECVRVTCSTITISPDDLTSWENLMYSLEELQKREPFYRFIGHHRRLRTGKDMSKEELNETLDNLLQVVEKEFGNDFVKTLSLESWVLNYPTLPNPA